VPDSLTAVCPIEKRREKHLQSSFITGDRNPVASSNYMYRNITDSKQYIILNTSVEYHHKRKNITMLRFSQHDHIM